MGWILAIDCGSTATTAATNDGRLALLEIDGVTRLPSDLARILDAATRRQGGSAPDEVVLTHRAQWTDEQRTALLETADRAGLPNVTTLVEPVAAARHVVDDDIAVGDHVAVCNLSGRILDVAVLRRTADDFELLAAPGDGDGDGDAVVPERDDFARAAARLGGAVAAAGLAPSDLRAVYLVGDPSHIPLARQAIGDALGLEPVVGADPESAVALGAAARPMAREPLAVPIAVPRREKSPEVSAPAAPVAAVAGVVAAGSAPTTRARIGSSSARKVALATGAAVVFVALVTTVVVTRSGNDVASTAVSSSGAPTTTVAADGTLNHAFATTLYEGLRVARTWSYAPDGKLLASQVVATNPDAETQTTAWHDVIPKEVAIDVGLITFDPAPDAIVERDPVVRYDLTLGPGESATLRWSTALVDDLDADGLAALAAKRNDADEAFQASRSTTTTLSGTAAVTSTTIPNSSAAPTASPASGSTTVAPAVAPTTAVTSTTEAPVSVSAPGSLRSLRVSDPIATRSANGIPEEVQITLEWSPPTDDGGEAPTSYKIRCTLMQGVGSRATVVTQPAGSNQDCVGGVDMATVDGASRSTTVTTKRVDSGPSTWLKWEVSAVNRGGTGPPLVATVLVPNIVGRFTFEAYPLSRAVGLSIVKAADRACTTDSVICKQGLAASTTAESGAEFVASEKPGK